MNIVSTCSVLETKSLLVVKINKRWKRNKKCLLFSWCTAGKKAIKETGVFFLIGLCFSFYARDLVGFVELDSMTAANCTHAQVFDVSASSNVVVYTQPETVCCVLVVTPESRRQFCFPEARSQLLLSHELQNHQEETSNSLTVVLWAVIGMWSIDNLTIIKKDVFLA